MYEKKKHQGVKLCLAWISALGGLFVVIFVAATLYFDFRPLIYPTQAFAERYEDKKQVYFVLKNNGKNWGRAWVSYVLLSTHEEPLEKIIENTKEIAGSENKKMLITYPEDEIKITVCSLNDDQIKGLEHVHLLVLCETSFLGKPLNSEKAYYWDKRSRELVLQYRNNPKYKTVFNEWFNNLKKLPKEK